MHILHITPYAAPAYAFGGVPRAVEGLAQAQARRGHTVTVLTTDALTTSSRYTGPFDTIENGVRVVRVRNASVWLRGRANLSTPGGLRRVAAPLLRAADVAHCHEFRTLENLLVTPLAAHLGVPLVLSPHGTLPHGTGRSTLKALWDRLLSPAVARRFRDVVGLAQAEADDARALWGQLGAEANFHVVPNGVDMAPFETLPDGAAFRAQYELGVGPVVLYMARLHPRKGADVLARAFMQIERADARLVIAGPDEGLRPVLEALARENARIVLTGYLGGEARLAALAAADVFALVAVGEGLPMGVLEAMAAGLPVVVSAGCNLPEVAQAGAGHVVAVDAEAVASVLSALIDNREARGRMGAAARNLVRERFTWEAVAAQMDAVYQGEGT